MTRADLRFFLWNGLYGIAYAMFNVLFFASFGVLNTLAWVIASALGIGVWIASSTLRTLAQRRHWFDHGGFQLTLRLLAMVLSGATFTSLLVASLVSLAALYGVVDSGPAPNLGQQFGYWANIVIILGMWTALWAGRRSFHLRQMALLRAKSDRSALELDALRARLNAHFVFNALNNLRALINEDTERAREMVTRLSNTLRHALDYGAGDTVTLAEELAVVDDYLAIESVHYEERLRVRRDIADDMLRARLPPMLLQLMVENGIKHGIARTPAGGELSISAHRHGERLCIEITNPGQLPEDTAHRGVGLAYVRDRIADTWPGAQFTLEAIADGVMARLEIPQ